MAIQIPRGTTYIRNVTVTNSTSGLPENITDWIIYFTVKCVSDTDITDSKALIQKTFNNGNFTDAINGEFQLSLSATETQLALGNYIFDFKTIKPDGQQGDTLTQEFDIVATATNLIT